VRGMNDKKHGATVKVVPRNMPASVPVKYGATAPLI
jgi:hypothetical protein